ncbi:hypothetical protein [Natrinema hispanicum]|uniref:Uncharacterized protein n=1 Tax=Natrinema hispanicum TaxID=392421 RepID=A0A1G6KRR1_9EURY|nr:hypothetical protein [Natrinema hispanicum]SDC33643.1 hypothetical protein SAMN05192552_100353 [Natrinema hispanicum]SET06876.1 hypothetical protein SAMN04488694_103255 [Natrinema hispanicum]
MTDPTLATVERALDRAADLETEDAVAVLQAARDDVRTLADDSEVDEDRRQELATRLDQRLREVTERDAYDSGLGAAMNPTEDDAP